MSGAEEMTGGERTRVSWRSKDSASWWNSAVRLRSNLSSSAKELTSTLASKMDQVPITLAGFTLPWQPASNQKEQQSKLDQQQQSSYLGLKKFPRKHHPSAGEKEEERKSSELLKPVGERLPIPPGPPLTAADLQTLSKVGDSHCRTKRLPVDTACCKTDPNDDNDDDNNNLFSACSASLQAGDGLSSVSQRFLGDAQINALGSSNSMENYLPKVESQSSNAIQHQVLGKSVMLSSFDADVKHVNEASLILSEGGLLPPSNHSFAQPLPCPPKKKSTINSQQIAQGESKHKTLFVHATNVEPAIQKDNVFPGNTNTLLPIRLQTSSSISSEHSRTLANMLLFESEYASTLSKSPVLGGSMRAVRDFGMQLDSSAAMAPVSLPTTPRARAESRTSRLLRRLKLGGGKGSHGRGMQVGQDQPKSHNQDMPPPVIRAQKHGKKDSKALKAGSETTKERSLEVEEGNHRKNSFQSSQLGQCSDEQSSKVAKTQQRKLNNHWPFNKWKWNSTSRGTKVVSEEDHNNNVHIIRSFDTSSQEFSTTSETMYDACESFSERFVRFSSPQLKKSSSLDRGLQHRTGSMAGSGRDVTASSSHQLLPPPPPVPCSAMAAIADLNMLSSNQPTTTTCEEPVILASAACFQASKDSQEEDSGQEKTEEENMAEVFVDCEGGESRHFVKKQMVGMSMESEELKQEEMHTPPVLPQEQNLTIEDVAALCSSPIKFLFKCSEIEHFNKFLRAQKKRLISSSSFLHHDNNNDCFHIVRSGAECEVSSMVSALLMVWLMEHTVAPPVKTANKWHLVPVMNIPRQSMHNHKDAAWLFDACGVDAHALLFSDEVEFQKLMEAGRIRTQDIGQDLLVMKNEVGSMCTLLGEQLQMEAQCLLQARYMKTLLLAGILLDTENLDFAARRDTEMATALLVGSGSLGRNGFYKQLREVEGEARVSKLVTRMYGEAPQLSRQPKSGEEIEADHEHSDKDSYFSSADGHCSHEQTSTSEASNSSSSSSLDEDSPRLQTLPTALPAKIISASASCRFHRLPSPSGVIRRSMEANAVAQIRQAAAGNQSLRPKGASYVRKKPPPPPPPRRLKPGSNSFSRIRKKLYNA
ncbi:hypothetical protein CY35_09G009200 [Sphagnum magellanicum]|jgi:hypothetical protein|nr:hypothetical protein CY35_09G009200 [Sphagnum magellanicum]